MTILIAYLTFISNILRNPLELKGFQSKRLRCISVTHEIIDKVLMGYAALAACLHLNVPYEWTEFGADPLLYARKKLIANPDSESW